MTLNRPTTTKALPGDLAMWFFIMAELLVFAVFFASYAFARSNNVEMFNEFQLTLNRDIGAANTVILITGSYFVVRAVQAMSKDQLATCRNWLLAAVLMAIFFLVLKSVEFNDKFSQGISLSTNSFYMFYLSLTFFHFMHVILGTIILLAHGRSGVDCPFPTGVRAAMRTTYVWVLLIVLTVITWGAGKAGLEGLVLASGLLVSVWIKGHFVIADFMDLRGAPMLWRALTHGWLVLVMGLIFIAYMIGA